MSLCVLQSHPSGPLAPGDEVDPHQNNGHDQQDLEEPSHRAPAHQGKGSASVSVAPVGVSPTESACRIHYALVNPFRRTLNFGVLSTKWPFAVNPGLPFANAELFVPGYSKQPSPVRRQLWRGTLSLPRTAARQKSPRKRVSPESAWFGSLSLSEGQENG